MGYRLGIDVGGTFTDLVLYDDVSSALSIEKVPSVPADPADGIVQGIVRLLRAAGVAPAAVGYVAHGTTAATNALLERKGARTALITTAAISAVPLLLKSPLMKRLGLPLGGTLAAAYLLTRPTGHHHD